MGCIYGIRNEVNQKWYIGQSMADANKRKREHFNGTGSRLLKMAFSKYGTENFTFHILHDGILPIFLDSYEIQTIKEYNSVAPNGYNIEHGGRSATPSKETRKKMSIARKGKPPWNKGKTGVYSKEHLRKMSEMHRRPKHTKESRLKISQASKGRKVSIQTREKISKAHKGKKLSADHRRKLSEASKGRKRKPCSESTREKIGNANRSPYYNQVKDFFFSLPIKMSIREKRKKVLTRFPNISHTSIYEWINKWLEE